MVSRNRGISLVSLIIVVVSIIILISIVVNVGYNYIEETSRTEGETVLKLISDGAVNRQNDIHVEVDMYYVGYPLNPDELTNIVGLPDDFAVETNDLWYFIDANSAAELGVKESDKFIEKDLKNPTKEVVKTVLVDYVTGEAYLVEIRTEFIAGVIEDTTCNQSPDDTHTYSIQTCTKGSFCIYCGVAQTGHESGLGHDFLPATCTAAGICSRCGAINTSDPARGHSFPTNPITGDETWITDATKHWKTCEKCGIKKDTEEHLKGYVRIKLSDSPEVYDAKYHKELCSVCGWESVKTPHQIAYEVTGDYTHRRYCELCEYSEEHVDSGWIVDDPTYHWRNCTEDCESLDGVIDCINGDKLFYDRHVDKNNDNVCDICLKVLDNTPPNSFDSPGSYARVDLATTSELYLSAYTTDDLVGVGIKGYSFGIDYKDGNGIVWDEIVETEEEPGARTYIDLIHNTQYDIFVKAFDKGENVSEAYKIPLTITAKVPDVKGVLGVPSDYVKDSFTVQFQDLNTTLPNLSIEYSTDGGTTWLNETVAIVVDKENVELRARVKDKRKPEPNRGDVWGPVNITNLDLTPPEIAIAPKDGDNPTALQTNHTAIVTLRDVKVGITPGTTVQYAWSLSNTIKPTTYSMATTSNTSTSNSATVEITTPTGVTGEYYLWINEGVADALGNKTTEAVCSPNKYNVDDQDVTIGSIRMYNANPEIAGITDYVKTNGIVTVSFVTSKALRGAPEVAIGGVKATDVTSSDRINWTATITANTSMPEGKLSLSISKITTLAGKDSANTYDEGDLIEGPVIYDNTLPVIENVDK